MWSASPARKPAPSPPPCSVSSMTFSLAAPCSENSSNPRPVHKETSYLKTSHVETSHGGANASPVPASQVSATHPQTRLPQQTQAPESTRSLSRFSRSRTPTPLTTSWKSPLTGPRSCSATSSNAPSPGEAALLNPASSLCAPSSTDASISPRPKPSAISSSHKPFTRLG